MVIHVDTLALLCPCPPSHGATPWAQTAQRHAVSMTDLAMCRRRTRSRSSSSGASSSRSRSSSRPPPAVSGKGADMRLAQWCRSFSIVE